MSAEKTKFKVFTKAVCERKDEETFCRDELFVKCNDKEHQIDKNNPKNLTECDNIKLNLSDIYASGDGVFEKEWMDPRNKNP